MFDHIIERADLKVICCIIERLESNLIEKAKYELVNNSYELDIINARIDNIHRELIEAKGDVAVDDWT